MSPSDIFQRAVIEEKRAWDLRHHSTAKLEKEIERLEFELFDYIQFLQASGKWEDFKKWRVEKYKENVLEQKN